MKHDKARDTDLEKLSIKTLRYSNESINKNFMKIAEDILQKLNVSFDDLKPIKEKHKR